MLTMVSINSDTGYRAVPQLPVGVDDYGEEYKDLPVCPAFKQIGELRGPFDLGLIPIGAYWPRWYVYPPPPTVSVFFTTPHSLFLLILELCRGARTILEVLLQFDAFYVSRMDYLCMCELSLMGYSESRLGRESREIARVAEDHNTCPYFFYILLSSA